jgi:hypothetical protein
LVINGGGYLSGIGASPPVAAELQVAVKEVAETEIVAIRVEIVVCNRRRTIGLEEEDSGIVVTDDVVDDLDRRVAEVDPFAFVRFDEVAAKDEVSLAETRAVDIVVDVAVLDDRPGEVGVQGVGRVADFAVAQLRLLGEVDADLQPVPRQRRRGSAAKADRLRRGAEGAQAPLDDQGAVPQTVLVVIAAEKGNVAAGGDGQSRPLEDFGLAFDDDPAAPCGIGHDLGVVQGQGRRREVRAHAAGTKEGEKVENPASYHISSTLTITPFFCSPVSIRRE